MSRRIGVSLTALVALFLTASTAPAQVVPPYLYNRPTFAFGAQTPLSPYLNLVPSLNGVNNPAVNYFLQTIPEIERRRNNTLYGAAIGGLEAQALNPAPPAVADVDLFTPSPVTGHQTAFQYTGGYFPTVGGARATGPTTGQRPTTTPRPPTPH